MDRAEQQAYFVSAINGVAGGDLVPVPGGVLIKKVMDYRCYRYFRRYLRQ